MPLIARCALALQPPSVLSASLASSSFPPLLSVSLPAPPVTSLTLQAESVRPALTPTVWIALLNEPSALSVPLSPPTSSVESLALTALLPISQAHTPVLPALFQAILSLTQVSVKSLKGTGCFFLRLTNATTRTPPMEMAAAANVLLRQDSSAKGAHLPLQMSVTKSAN